tara:strand:+ start:328 stop:567 length:240 start_codon:yes stop_codon:yes gene_type:complete
MKKFILTMNKNKEITDVGNTSIVYIFENITGYEDEVFSLLEKKQMPIKDLENIVNSWGGKVRSVPVKSLIENYYKNNLS